MVVRDLLLSQTSKITEDVFRNKSNCLTDENFLHQKNGYLPISKRQSILNDVVYEKIIRQPAQFDSIAREEESQANVLSIGTLYEILLHISRKL